MVADREWVSFSCEDPRDFRRRLLLFARLYEHVAILDSCENTVYGENDFDLLAGIGKLALLTCPAGQAFKELKAFRTTYPDWMFGYFAYDLKNEVEALSSQNADELQFPDLQFLVPTIVVKLKGQVVEIGALPGLPNVIWEQIVAMPPEREVITPSPVQLKARMSKESYLQSVRNIQQHIAKGDMYEMNFCQEFYADSVRIHPYQIFDALCTLSKAPYAAFFRMGSQYIMSASPERFLKKSGKKIISQPVKGTAARVKGKDEQTIRQLRDNEKEKAEHIMITDLVRNDLTPFAVTGSVQVEALGSIFSFAHVHQMVSVIKAELRHAEDGLAALQQAFPMGSMTGAPKVSAMKWIEQYEVSKRGCYSGALGYIQPDGDFDFNVVIRSLLYNAQTRYLSTHAGGAIVIDSIPEQEYEECLLKMTALQQVLQAS